MAEIRKHINYYEVDMTCDRCRIGRMRLKVTNPILGASMYVHQCDKCGYIDNYSVRYPYRIDGEQ